MTISFDNDYPLGFRFNPTDVELVDYYLKNKLLGNDIVNSAIAEIDFYKYEPWELPAFSVVKSDDPEWFFLCRLYYKSQNSKKINRETHDGFWKATGKDRNIKIRGTNKIIGIKKTLVYHKGRVPNVAVRTNWIMHEYRDVTFEENQRTFVLCRLMKKAETKAEGEDDEGEPSRHMSSNNENLETTGEIFDALYEAGKYSPCSTQQSSTSNCEQKISTPGFQLMTMDDFEAGIKIPLFETFEEEKDFVANLKASLCKEQFEAFTQAFNM